MEKYFKAAEIRNSNSKIWTIEFLKMFFVATIISFSTQFQATTFPLYVQSLGGGLMAAGAMTSIYMGASALWKPFVGKVLGKYSRKKVYVLSGIVFSLIMFSFGFISSIPLLMLIRVINAPFYSLCNTSATTITTDILPEDRVLEGLGYYNLAQTLSYALGPGIALFLINDFSYRALFTACAVFGLLSLIVGSTVKYEDPILDVYKKSSSKEDKDKRKYANKDAEKNTSERKLVYIPSLIVFLIMLGCSGLVTFLPTWASAKGIDNIGLFFTVQAVALALSRMFVGRISKKIGIPQTIIGSTILITVSLFGISYCNVLLPLLFLSILYGIGFGSVIPTLHSIAIINTGSSERGMANSMIQMATDAGICISSLFLGCVADLIGITRVFFVAAFFTFCAILVFIYLLLRNRQVF